MMSTRLLETCRELK